MGRTLIVGDVHGCRRELEDLLGWVGFGRADRLISVGDLVVRGPDPHGVLALCREIGARSVRGNHEDRLLRWRRSLGTGQELKIGQLTRRTAATFTPKDWAYIEAMPLWIDLPEHETRVVHAGLVPGVPMHQQDPRALMNIRSLGARGEALEVRADRAWAHAYRGPPHVVYGHNAQPQPEIAEFATGLDTSCVYGGRLTAMVLRRGERPPPAAERTASLVSVPARRAYYVKRPKPPADGASD